MNFNVKICAVALGLAVHVTGIANASIPDWSKFIPGSDSEGSVHYGPTRINNEKIKGLTIYGPASVSNTSVTNETTIKGPIEASYSSFENMHIDGIAKLDHVKVSGELNMNGPVYAFDSDINEISIATSELRLSNTRVTKLVVRKNDNPQRQRVYLERQSKVDTLIFEAKDGIVVLIDSTASVGKLEGGEILKN